ncbi:MAG: hypothetical protein ACKO34_09420 [Vampirovibrionales bacterium]
MLFLLNWILLKHAYPKAVSGNMLLVVALFLMVLLTLVTTQQNLVDWELLLVKDSVSNQSDKLVELVARAGASELLANQLYPPSNKLNFQFASPESARTAEPKSLRPLFPQSSFYYSTHTATGTKQLVGRYAYVLLGGHGTWDANTKQPLLVNNTTTYATFESSNTTGRQLLLQPKLTQALSNAQLLVYAVACTTEGKESYFAPLSNTVDALGLPSGCANASDTFLSTGYMATLQLVPKAGKTAPGLTKGQFIKPAQPFSARSSFINGQGQFEEVGPSGLSFYQVFTKYWNHTLQSGAFRPQGVLIHEGSVDKSTWLGFPFPSVPVKVPANRPLSVTMVLPHAFDTRSLYGYSQVLANSPTTYPWQQFSNKQFAVEVSSTTVPSGKTCCYKEYNDSGYTTDTTVGCTPPRVLSVGNSERFKLIPGYPFSNFFTLFVPGNSLPCEKQIKIVLKASTLKDVWGNQLSTNLNNSYTLTLQTSDCPCPYDEGYYEEPGIDTDGTVPDDG